MKPIEFIKLILRHKTILIIVPLFFGLLAILFTSNSKRNYYSQTTLFTGIASGSSIQMDKSFNYLAANNAFDNLINIIKSRDTQKEVAIRLLSQHLSLKEANHKFIANEAFEELHEILPDEIKVYLSKQDSLDNKKIAAYLTNFMGKDNSNFVYSLLSFDHPHYSLQAISKVKVERISSSDLVKLSYEIDDPGICQQTLKIYTEVCIERYKSLKENGSDAVVKYFETQLMQSEKKLKSIEQKLLKFNQDNNIINYYEQSKAVAIVKEDMDVAYNKGVAQLAGSRAATKRLENNLATQHLIQEKNNAIIESKKELGELNYKIAIFESKANSENSYQEISNLKEQARRLQNQIKKNVDELYTFNNTTDGVPIKKVLPDWVDKVVETEDLKAKLSVMDSQNKAIQKQFATYAPAGANLKRIEREIEVAEQEYLEILHGLNLAKLKFQDIQLSSNLKSVDPPFYPLNPVPSKRKLIVVAIIIMVGFILLASILFMEYFDDTLKNDAIASEKLGVPAMGMLPKLFKTNKYINLIKIQDRLMEFVMQNFDREVLNQCKTKRPKIVTVFSTQNKEGKSVIAANIAKKLKDSGYSILLLNHSSYNQIQLKKSPSSLVHKIFGYQDPRIDYNHPFLSQPKELFDSKEYIQYEINKDYKTIKSYNELLVDAQVNRNQNPDYIIIELPNILECNYPSELLTASDLVLMICRSNRLWTKADNNILAGIKQLVGERLQFIINGVELKEVETILGELPKKRSKVRVRIKNMFRFQFYTANQI